MKILIAPDSFKGSLSAQEVGNAIQLGIQRVDPGIDSCVVPMADGGEGTVQSLVDASGGHIVNVRVHDPLRRETNSFYGIMGDGATAVIEMAAASGLPLLQPGERNPLKTTTVGTGELIIDAIDKGCSEIILGIGGSATNDGGTGMATALGIRFLDKNSAEIDPDGGSLSLIHSVDWSGMDPRIRSVKFTVACDVDNPLCGPNGAAEIYGRQKGATDNDVMTLDKGLLHFAEIVSKDPGKDLKDRPGAGAAGGLGFGIMTFLNAELSPGIDIVTRMTNLDEKMIGADLVITGEGMIDAQTAYGKTPFGVAQLAKRRNIPVIAIAGSLGKGYQELYNRGFDMILSIIDNPMSLEEAFSNTKRLLSDTAESIVHFWKRSMERKR